ncbi:ATP-binding cassette sub-family G member 4 [Drosophila guanche]|uniref:Blast:ATP-binding cassette sub-family G member 1 n=1 Tax=Drosophila guanche TaxID=7266 RepID=A0A3B0JAL5_DROGU|nr:ATP-binding cassette sub-family G member 4 [Drosophila guanche]XP_034125567.1 ATP-binding cassette sub-family G member 4 [Drosophila guanche]XP_034125568.1 ATP-binding cassette sub-family G member 4 [Drosophila guanche]XP_034125569.1 ATP-binding cassette sub-family G member 4 [Drosophila guanche]SPP79357.1 blast:ATP-binding cassette sub-family G member 1 [Drosophila guanche]
MTLLPDIKPSDAACCGGGAGSDASSTSGASTHKAHLQGKHHDSGCLGINCCTTAASSELSIDETSSTSSRGSDALAEKVNNNLNVFQRPNFHEGMTHANFDHCEPVDIEFSEVRYQVKKFSFPERKFVAKEILHGLNGSFRSGELTAIMGPSGAGKSTLLNVMSGFCATGVSGNIRVNGKPMAPSSERFRQLLCYIHQDDLLRPQLMVGEIMLLAAHLKLGFKVSKAYKLDLIKHILSLLGLEHRYNVHTAKLSGGQKKRLAIALELISNPPVLYLDEPTTGLDSSSCSSCVALLKKLASQGHTIVCTIHQPSALIFEMFDKLYTVVDGHCMYQGPVRELVPFLAEQQLVCPSYHNPADYLLEVAVGEHQRDLNELIHAANKKYYEDVDRYRYMSSTDVSRLMATIKDNIGAKELSTSSQMLPTVALAQFSSYDYVKPAQQELALEEIKALSGSTELELVDQEQSENQQQQQLPLANVKATVKELAKPSNATSSASFLMQYVLLMQRIMICARRNYFLLLARIFSHIFIGVVFGYLYLNVGNNAQSVLGNYVYLYGSTLLLVYTGKMAVVLTFPLEIDMLTREHFNRWYKLGPYFLSLISFEIPFQSLCTALYIIISVHLTGNDSVESFRIYYFMLLGIMASLSAQAWGFFVGATLPTKLAVFLGPILAVMFSVFGFCTRYIDITPLFRWMWHLSYFRAGFHGALNAIYGMDRAFLECPENTMYCHFRSPKVFLKYMMISDVHMSDCLLLMGIVIGVMHVLTILTLWHKLNKR